MAIQAQMYPENLGLPLSSQDWLFMSNNNMINNFNNSNNNNNNLLYNGCGLNEFSYNNLQQKQQQQQQQILYQQQQQYLLQLQNMQQKNSSDNNNSFVFSASKGQNLATTTATTTTATTTSTTTSASDQMSMNISQSLSTVLEKQRQEIDRYITLQNERMKLALQQQRKQQLAVIIRKLEEKAMQLLQQKDNEIAVATKKAMDLEEIMRRIELENQAWQRLAAENEALVISLNNKLEQIKEQACCVTNSMSSSNEVDDAESCCNVYDNRRGNEETGGNSVAETGENRGVFGSDAMCKVCNSRNACILLLPCRHLCCCKACESSVDACPVCKSAKMSSIEALIS